MSSFAFYASLEAARLLGTELLRLDPKNEEGRDDVEMERLALAAGFAAVSRGERVIADALEDLTTLATGSHRKAKWAFGMFYEALSHDLAAEPTLSLSGD